MTVPASRLSQPRTALFSWHHDDRYATLAAELRSKGIAVNALWPRTLIATSALNIAGSALGTLGRTPDIMADAAYEVLTRNSRDVSGQFFVDEQVLRDAGVSDFSPYLVTPGTEPMLDLYIDA